MIDIITASKPALAPAVPVPAARPVANSAVAEKLLARSRGATIAEMQTATGWQPHSARAFLSGLRKAGRTLVKEERKSGETSYRLVAVAAAAGTGSEASE
ncbi:MAG: hypothetical protein B7Y35_10115 [Sphingomonadales bacterium 28-64-96]|nr:MAG: hypothetical protein B7Y35_10115 [Sphingomonadales bacterium 28-64-96]